jgi:hypothetical protein
MQNMKRIALLLLIGLFVVSGSAIAADKSGTLTVGTATGAAGTSVSVPISFTGDGVHGVAFTLTPGTGLTFTGLEKATDGGEISDPDAESLTDDDVVGSTLYYQVNKADGMVAAAAAEAITAGTLFNAKFDIASDAAEGDITIGVAASVIDNTSAGYDSAGEAIDILVGDPDSGDQFTTETTDGTVIVPLPGTPGDASGDGVVDSTDALYILYFDAGLVDETALNLSMCDVSGDGVVDSTDALYILYLDAGLITEFP